MPYCLFFIVVPQVDQVPIKQKQKQKKKLKEVIRTYNNSNYKLN